MDLKALAKEREARRGIPKAPPPSAAPTETSARRAMGTLGGPRTAAARTAPSRNSAAGGRPKMHRSVRLARSLALAGLGADLLCWALLSVAAFRVAFVAAACVYLARAGGAFLHGALPACLVAGPAPTAREISDGASWGLFAGEPARLSAECDLALESLAWCVTYGEKNCLTADVARDPSLSNMASLVYGKLKQGVLRCD